MLLPGEALPAIRAEDHVLGSLVFALGSQSRVVKLLVHDDSVRWNLSRSLSALPGTTARGIRQTLKML